MCKYRERESVMIFSVPLMCSEYRDFSLLTRLHLIQQATASWDYVFTRSKDALCIQPIALELSVKANMCDPCPSCRMVIYMDIADAMNSRRFSFSFPCHDVGILHSHNRPLLLYPQIPY